MKKRTLTLSRESLTELSIEDLDHVVGAASLLGKCWNASLLCITDDYRTTCLNCEA